MQKQDAWRRAWAAVAYGVTVIGTGSVLWDLWEFSPFPTLRTWLILAVNAVVVIAARWAGPFVREHAQRALSVHALTFLLWTMHWASFWLVEIGWLQPGWRRIDGPYFVMLVLATLVVGMGVAAYCVESAMDAIESKTGESLVRVIRRRARR